MNTRESGGVTPTDDFTRRLLERFARLVDATIGDVAEVAQINRDTVSAVFKGGGSPKSKGKVADALTRMEQEAGIDPAAPLPSDLAAAEAEEEVASEPPFVRLRVEHPVAGSVTAIVWEGSPDQLPEIEKSVDRLMRRLLAEASGSDDPETEM